MPTSSASRDMGGLNDMGTLTLLRLLQLASSNLPVGGYTFSQGLEYAIEEGWLKQASDVKEWIEQVATLTLTYSDLPLIHRQYTCIAQQDWATSEEWNHYALAIRETRELLLADTAMGEALLRLAKGMNIPVPAFCLVPLRRISFTTMFSLIAKHMNLNVHDACTAYAWTVIENQVLAATKLLPLGQTAAQTMLYELSGDISGCIKQAEDVGDTALGISLPGLAMASAKHEIQYSRLYRS